jgi:macrolide transport system ATP-binding/permease protein
MSSLLFQFYKVSFKYPSSVSDIIEDLTIQLSPGFTGLVGSNGSGKTTLLKLAANYLFPTSGKIIYGGNVYYCEQRTDNLPENYKSFISSFEKQTYRLKDILMIEDSWFKRWETLSHGERKRCQIACALFAQPNILLIDEPTNHIDLNTKKVLINALKTFNGIGVIVSHDRQLLDELCTSILSIDDNTPKVIRGNYTTFEKEKLNEYNYRVHRKENINKEIKKLEKEVKSRKQKASNADKKRSKRNISSKDHDAKSKIDAARLTGKDATEGKIYNRLSGRLNKMIEAKDELGSTAKRETGIKIDSTASAKRVLLYKSANSIKLNEKVKLCFPDLYINRLDKIGFIGNNGTGKSTLLKHLVNQLSKMNSSFAYIPQEISAEESAKLLKETFQLKDDAKGKIFTIISRLNSEPKQLFESVIPSPGEVRKLMLAKAILDKQELIIMDEPTNHMDLPSIQCIESALKEFNGALLLVSHDKVFLNNAVDTYWRIESEADETYTLGIQ